MSATAPKKAGALNGKSRSNTKGDLAGNDPLTTPSLSTNGVNGNGPGFCRTTAVIPAVLNMNWEVYALKSGLPKNEVLVKALIFFLKSEGYKPELIPQFDVSYPRG